MAVGLVALGLLASCTLFFKGPYQPVAPLLRVKLLDLHCHTAGLGAGGSGCFVSRELEQSYKFGIYLKAFGVTRAQLAQQGPPVGYGASRDDLGVDGESVRAQKAQTRQSA